MSIKMNKAVEENKDPCKIKWLGCPDCRKKTCFNTEDLIVDIGRCATLRLLRKKDNSTSNTSSNIEPSDGGGELAASMQKREASNQPNIEGETPTSVGGGELANVDKEEVVSIANRILSSMHTRTTSTQRRKRKKYQDITKTEEGRKRFKAAINTSKITSSNEQLVTIGGKRDSNDSTDTSSATAVQSPSNKVTKQQQKRSAPRKRGETERKEIQQAVSIWNSQYKDQINPSTGVIWTLTEFVETPDALDIKYGTLYDYCRDKKAKDVSLEKQNIKIPNRQLTQFIRSMAQRPNNSRSQVINSLRLELQLGYRQACNQYENNVKEQLNSLLASRPTIRRTTFDQVEHSSEYNVKQPLMSLLASTPKEVSTQKKTKRGPYIDWSLPENQARLYYLVTTFNNSQDNGKCTPSLSAYAKTNHIAYKTIQPYCCKNVLSLHSHGLGIARH